jgi:hypothetical protein
MLVLLIDGIYEVTAETDSGSILYIPSFKMIGTGVQVIL